MNQTVSQKIARVFEIAGYLWLAPSIISLFFSFLMLLDCLVLASARRALISVTSFLLFGAGFVLLVQYYRHARGRLDERKINALWIKTLVFNLLFLLPSVYGSYSILKPGLAPRGSRQEIFIFVWGLFILWWSMAVMLSITALMSRLKNQKYR